MTILLVYFTGFCFGMGGYHWHPATYIASALLFAYVFRPVR